MQYKRAFRESHDNSENVKRFGFKPQSVVDIITRSWGEVTHSSHVDAFQSHPCLENTPLFSFSHPNGQVGAAVEGTCVGVSCGPARPTEERGFPLAVSTKALKIHHRTWAPNQIPKERLNFHADLQKTNLSAACFSLFCVRIYYDTNVSGLQT